MHKLHEAGTNQSEKAQTQTTQTVNTIRLDDAPAGVIAKIPAHIERIVINSNITPEAIEAINKVVREELGKPSDNPTPPSNSPSL